MIIQIILEEQDYFLSFVLMNQCKSVWFMGLILFGFIFFIVIMWVGGSIGVVFDFFIMFMVLVVGNLLLGFYVVVFGYIVVKIGFNMVLMS